MADSMVEGGSPPVPRDDERDRGRPRRNGPLQRLQAFRRLPQKAQRQRLACALIRPFAGLALGPGSRAAQAGSLPMTPPQDPWPGDAEKGADLLQGRFSLAGRTLVDPHPLWAPRGAGEAWRRELQTFAWLRDLRSVGGDQARRAARELTLAWIGNRQAQQGLARDPVVIGQRLSNWLGFYEFFVASAEIDVRTLVLESLERQARILNRLLPAGLAGADLVAALKGLIYAGCSLPGQSAWRNRAVQLIETELPHQVLADGGHIERSPDRHLAVLRDLLDLRAVLQAAEIEPPPALVDAITVMAPVLRLWRHGDGGLALFNGSSEGEPLQIDMVLQRCPGPKRPHTAAPECGFHRLQAGRSLLIVDAGAPPPAGLDLVSHAGTGAFEFSVGRERVIVNCGSQTAMTEWIEPQKATAAHSALVVENTNSSEVLAAGGLGRRPDEVTCRREEVDGHVLLELAHDGYRSSFGLVHRRRLYLSPQGDDLRGEDCLEGDGLSGAGKAFQIRFHLHPDVRASLAQAGDSLFLRTPKGSGWRLRAAGAELGLEPSVYLGQSGAFRRGEQVVLSGRTEGASTTVKWALQREKTSRK